MEIDTAVGVVRAAFGREEEAKLVADLLADPSAAPTLSLFAFEGERAVGHILFTRLCFEEGEKPPLMHLLAPMAVLPAWQSKGIGGQLIGEGLRRLKAMGSELAFVLGHPSYYPRYGFTKDAARLGFQPPYPIPPEQAAAWMVQVLQGPWPDERVYTMRCADVLNKEAYWRE